MYLVLLTLGFIVALIGLMGCFLPFLIGPPISFLSLIILSYAQNWEPFSTAYLILFGILAVILTVLDNFMPVIGAKKYGASRPGLWGSMAGMLIGFFFFPPWGVFIGTFLGAVTGEIISGKKDGNVLKIGWGVCVGNIMAIGLKFAYSSLVFVVYVFNMF
jgi:uncharacterized protein YqgC (DUF456 family)